MWKGAGEIAKKRLALEGERLEKYHFEIGLCVSQSSILRKGFKVYIVIHINIYISIDGEDVVGRDSV